MPRIPIPSYLTALFFAFFITLSGCDVIGGIFEAGVWVGVLIVVLVIALIIWLIKKMVS